MCEFCKEEEFLPAVWEWKAVLIECLISRSFPIS
uniref:Uncharacterized protein n=1 Tax=Moniliophthora roreri TaxID=221103 RepID=A0A0W0F9N4_MONRR